MNTQHTINGIGNSMKHWANYINDVKRGAIINESAIKFGISEYLVASWNFADDSSRNKDMRVPQIQEIHFERTHCLFKGKRIDLSFNITDGEDVTEVFFEFKYLHDIPLPKNEIDRYIDDLFRLASLVKQNNESKKYECYFMLVGDSKKVKQLVDGSVTATENNREQIKGLPKTNNADIENCFSLQKNKTKKVVLGNLSSGTGVPHLKRFKEKYLYRDEIDEVLKLEDSDCMKIRLKYTTRPTDEEVGVYIWQVKI